jgi:hypothetical protein
MLMILGVGIRMFPALFGFRAPSPRLVVAVLIAVVLGVLGESAFFVTMRLTGNHAWALAMYGGMLLLAGASIAVTWQWGVLARPTEHDRSIKFVRSAVVWLHVSMVLLIILPVYVRVVLPGAGSLSASGREALDMGFSHAYYGAVRHAITVGFISMTILGMAAKVVPTLNGVDVRTLRPLWLPFLLVNVGCFMRVAFQIATDFQGWAYPIAGVSGLFEVTGIAIWGVHLWRIMNGWQPAPEPKRGRSSFPGRQQTTDAAAEKQAASLFSRPVAITADDKIGWIVEWFPQTLPLLLEKGFTPLANPVLRRTMARTISVRTAASHHQLDLDAFLEELNVTAFAGGDACRNRSTGTAAFQV